MYAGEASEPSSLVHLVTLAQIALGCALLIGRLALVAVIVVPAAIAAVLGRKLPYRTILFALGETVARRSVDASGSERTPPSAAVELSTAGGAD